MASLFHYMTLAIDKLNGRGLSNSAHRKCFPKKTKNAVLATEVPGNSNKLKRFSYKGEWANL